MCSSPTNSEILAVYSRPGYSAIIGCRTTRSIQIQGQSLQLFEANGPISKPNMRRCPPRPRSRPECQAIRVAGRTRPGTPGIRRNADKASLCNSVRVSSYLLRVQLADRPGSLGSLAVALGSVGADILSLDVVDRGPGYAIDDLVVELPPGGMPDTLITAAEALQGVRVDSLRPHTGLLDAHRELA